MLLDSQDASIHHQVGVDDGIRKSLAYGYVLSDGSRMFKSHHKINSYES